MEKTSPILLFDSGIGGLTVLGKLRKLLPDAPIIYAADMAGLPYGAKSEPEIAARVAGLLGRMVERYRPRLVCIACNTASTIALGMVREVLGTVIVGTVPAIKPAAALTETGTFGLLGTEATMRQAYLDDLEHEFATGKRLLRHGTNDLVPLVEAKMRGEDIHEGDIANAVKKLILQPYGGEIDTIVLACTHFPLIEAELHEVMGPDIRFVDGSQGIANRIVSLTKGQEFHRERPDFAVTTGSLADFKRLSRTFADYGIEVLEAF